jgi:hypothetical protein
MFNPIIKYAFELTTDNVVNINNAMEKFYRCPGCGLKLKRAQGEIQEWHFKHHNDNGNCSGGIETARHQLAKQILKNSLQIKIPRYGIIEYSNPVLEKELVSKRPDVTAIYKGENIYFEIAVKHFVEPAKEEFFIDGEYKSIEIDLSDLPIDASHQEIENAVLKQLNNKRIIFWEKESLILVNTEPIKMFKENDLQISNELSWQNKFFNFIKENPLTFILIALFGILAIRQFWKKAFYN